MIRVSAPGKLMLLGEHAAVYGHPCIVTAVSQRLEVSASTVGYHPADKRFVDAAIRLWGDGKDWAFSIRSPFSGKYGFGSSAAVTVATLKVLRPGADNRAVFDAAHKIVQGVQGVGSGFDVAAVTYGGTIYYIKNQTIEPLKINNMPLIVGYTGIKSNTVEQIHMVAKKRDLYPEKVERIFQGMTKIVEEAKTKIGERDWERVGRLMDFNQDYLRDLGVSSGKLEALISAAKKAGAWGAKLSGAGGGDCMVSLASSVKREAICKAIREAGGEVVDVRANAEGVRIET